MVHDAAKSGFSKGARDRRGEATPVPVEDHHCGPGRPWQIIIRHETVEAGEKTIAASGVRGDGGLDPSGCKNAGEGEARPEAVAIGPHRTREKHGTVRDEQRLEKPHAMVKTC